MFHTTHVPMYMCTTQDMFTYVSALIHKNINFSVKLW